MPGYPIVLDLTDRLAIVVGLGSVGRRKVFGLIEAGATVRGIDPSACLDQFPNRVTVLTEPYREEHLDGASLVFAAAVPEVNCQVVADAGRRGLLVNSASDPTSGDFTVPSVWRSGPLLLSVSTSGAGPAFAAMIRDRLAEEIGGLAVDYAKVLVDLRPRVLDLIPEEAVRRALLRDWADPRWLSRLQSVGPDALRSEFQSILERLTSDAAFRQQFLQHSQASSPVSTGVAGNQGLSDNASLP